MIIESKPKKSDAWKICLLFLLVSFNIFSLLEFFNLSDNQFIWLEQSGDILLTAFLVIYYRRRYPDIFDLLKLKIKKFVFGFATSLSIVILTDELLIYFVSGDFKKATINITPKWLTLVAVGGIIAPITEEVIFRGIVLNLLLSSYKTHTAILLNEVIFLILHFGPLDGFGVLGFFIQFFHGFFFGILLSAMAYLNKNLSYGYGFHISNNIFSLII